MFGSGGFGGFGQPQQQQQQQQQQPQQQAGGMFGGGGGFGTPQAFGAPQATPTFGQPQQPQPGVFGGFGGAAAPGAFGGQAATPAFGTPSGGNMFRSSAVPATNSGFSFGGATNTAFGAPKTTAAPSTGLFGAKPATTFGGGGFGAPAPAAGGMFGGGAPAFSAPQQQPGTAGTSIAPFKPTPEEIRSTTKPDQFETFLHQSISCMDVYKNYSFEELRLQDYVAGRKTPTAAATPTFGGGFGQPAQNTFGAPAPVNNMFGTPTNNAFGQQPSTTPTFGAPATNLFGGGGTTMFGQPQQAAPSLFGAPASAAPAAGGLFGGGSFGQPQQPAATTAFGGFGAPKPAAPAFSFGASSAPPSTGLFGQPQAQQPTSLFGQQSAAPAAGGLFGQPAAAPATFSFGAPAAPKPLFGAPAAPAFGAAAPKPAFGGFGQTAAPSLFGAPAQPQQSTFGAPASGGLFGAPAPAFGAAPAPAFGGSSLFGAKPAAPMGGGLFGSAAPAAGGLFGQQPAQQQLQIQPQAQPSLFGSTGSSFLGGSYNPAQSTSVQGPQMYAMADDPNAYGANPLFANTSPRAPPPVSDKKEPAFKPFRSTGFNRSTSKLTRLRGFAPPVSATPPRASPLNFGASLGGAPGSNGRGSPLRLVNGIGDESALSPNAFVVRPSLKKLFIERRSASDSPGRIHSKDGSPVVEGGAPPRAKDAPAFSKSKVSFNPELEIPTRDRLAAVPTPHPGRPAEMEYPESSTPVKKSAGSSANLGEDSLDIDPSHLPTPLPRRSTPTLRVLKHGDYFTSPTLEVLQKLPSDSLRAVPNLIVGRIGYGQVEFQEPVDLTSIASVEDLLGGIVVLQDRNCTVYPPDYEGKPEGGYGLNVPAVITLERCWPLDKATREPIRDPTHPRLVQHIKRLRKLEDTEFVDFEAEEGRWVFSVAGF